jgi:RES domain-containing protein
MVYLAESVPGAILEVVVHLLENTVLPEGLKLIEVHYPDAFQCDTIEVADLSESWDADPNVTRTYGDDWLLRCRTAIIAVPSAIAPSTRNFLLNPAHPDAQHVKVERQLEFDLDRRIQRLADYALSYRGEASHVSPEN